MNDVILSLVINIDEDNCQKIDQIVNWVKKHKEIQIIFVASKNQKLSLKENSNIMQIFYDNGSYLDGFNQAIPHICGKFYKFGLLSSYISEIGFEKLLKYLGSCAYDLVLLKTVYSTGDKIEKKYKFSLNKMIDFNSNELPELKNIPFSTYLYAYIFSKKLLDVTNFDVSLYNSKFIYLLNIVKKSENILHLPNMTYLHKDALEKHYNDFEGQYELEWYLRDADELNKSFEKQNNVYTKIALLYYLAAKYACNVNGRNRSVLNDEDLLIFENKVREILSKIENSIIVGFKNRIYTNRIRELFLKYVNDVNDLAFQIVDDEIICNNNRDSFAFKNIDFEVNIMSYRNNALILDFKLYNEMLLNSNGKLKAVLDNQELNMQRNYIYSDTKFFGHTRNQGYVFSLNIPIEKITKTSKLYFMLCFDNQTYKLPIRFVTAGSKLDGSFKNSYFVFNNYIIKYDKVNSELCFTTKNTFKILFNEIKMHLELLRKKSLKRAISWTALSLAYWITKPYFANKRIWITFDKLYKGGDNGEYFYHYVNGLENKDNIKMYYTINKNAIDCQRLLASGEKNILFFNSFKHKLMVLHSDIIFGTHAGVMKFSGFGAQLSKFFKCKFNMSVVCIQHGLTIQDIPIYQNRIKDNTELYMLASKYEKKNLLQDVYGYEENQLKLVGLARYDGLKDVHKKQILITPTWRRSVVKQNNKMGNSREYNPYFKETTYFKVYNDLINDPKLIDAAKKHNYEIIYLLHPVVSCQAEDFHGNEYVKVIPSIGDISYETLLTESALMVTDYSGVQFDFAYMRKPILYYHPAELPPHYDNGGMDYENNGFGPIILNQKQLVDELCEYMDNECKIKDIYKERADDFFEYSDHLNCQRIYEETRRFFK